MGLLEDRIVGSWEHLSMGRTGVKFSSLVCAVRSTLDRSINAEAKNDGVFPLGRALATFDLSVVDYESDSPCAMEVSV